MLLVGQALPDDLPPPARLEDSFIMADMPAGLPSELLLRRPDILQAEAELRAEHADIGAARAAFFPSLSLTAGLGSQSSAGADRAIQRAAVAADGQTESADQPGGPLPRAGRRLATPVLGARRRERFCKECKRSGRGIDGGSQRGRRGRLLPCNGAESFRRTAVFFLEQLIEIRHVSVTYGIGDFRHRCAACFGQ